MQQVTPTRHQKLERLLEVSRMLHQAVDIEPFLQMLANSACELTQSEAASVFLFEEETGLLKFVASPRSHSEAIKRIRVPLEYSIAGRAYTQERPIVINDASLEPLVYKPVDQMLHFETRSILAAPIRYGSNPLGVIETINKLGNAHYTEEDVTILETLAGYAAIALFNTALIEETINATNEIQDLEKKKSDFVAITSHELRTPLGLILGHATFLQELATDEQTRQQLEVIVRSANRLKDIIESLSNLDSETPDKRRIRRQALDINKLVSQVSHSFDGLAKQKGIKLQVDTAEQALLVKGDAEKIAIALGNLVDNAVAFTNPGGRVRVSTERLPGFVKVSVVDNGIGIPPGELQRIFDRFYQVESHYTRRHGGMGLGLSVAKVMIEMHGGQIWAESVEGRGSNFSFLLPLGTTKSLTLTR